MKEKTKIMTINSKKEDTLKRIKEYKLNMPQLGYIGKFEHKISLHNNNPVHCKPFPVPHKLISKTREVINKLLDLKVIQESSSSFCSPAFPLLKKNGETRLVIDYRKLN